MSKGLSAGGRAEGEGFETLPGTRIVERRQEQRGMAPGQFAERARCQAAGAAGRGAFHPLLCFLFWPSAFGIRMLCAPFH